MLYLLLRLLHEEMTGGRISSDEYSRAVEKAAKIHGIRKNGLR